MKITRNHALALGYWRISPALRALAKLQPPNIDTLVNDHAGIDRSSPHSMAIHNALHLVTLRRRNGDPAWKALLPSEWDRANNVGRHKVMKRWHRKLPTKTIDAAACGMEVSK